MSFNNNDVDDSKKFSVLAIFVIFCVVAMIWFIGTALEKSNERERGNLVRCAESNGVWLTVEQACVAGPSSKCQKEEK